ncbi:MAG: mercuric reductase [Chloroflexi bacterium]|nr:mercuric reductase [Chloroflexota bacterium]
MKQYDAIVIGTGQSGPAMASALIGTGKSVAIAEGYRFGGSCVNYGCRPTKVMIASARAAHMARRGADFGVDIDNFTINWGRVKQRVESIVDTTSQQIEQWLRGVEGLDVYAVYASFAGKDGAMYRVNMGDEVIEAPQVFLNTGTRPRLPASVDGFDSVPWLDNEKILHLDTLPQHLMILGGNYIGLEMGQAFRRFGSEVTIIETSECVIHREDDDIQAEVHRFLTDEGIRVFTFSRLHKAEPLENGGVRLHIHDETTGSDHVIEGSHWLNAIGRVPNTDQLNLEAVGVETDKRGFVVVDEHLRTTAPNVFALGDINGKGAFTHTSYHDFEIVRDNLLHGRDRKWTDRTLAYNLYVDPPLGRVGMGENEARESGKNVLMATKPMSHIGRAIEQDETAGLIKVLVDADTEQFLGAAVLGFHGDEVIQAISYYMATGASYKIMMETLPIHPTIAEFLPTILGELAPLK